jgi:NAD(P)H-hydrate epimerase
MVPNATPKQIAEAFRLAVDSYGIDPLMILENAGRALAARARFLLVGDVGSESVVVCCGTGSNGGAGMAAARHLRNWGAEVTLAATGASDELQPAARRQWDALERAQVSQLLYYVPGVRSRLADAALVIDAVSGIGLEGDPDEADTALILAMNECRKPIISLDVPSGFNAATGRAARYCVKARSTLAVGLPTVGLYGPEAPEWVGELYLADVGIPSGAWEDAGIKPDAWFRKGELLRLPAPSPAAR